MTLTNEDLRKLLEDMIYIRTFEDRLRINFAAGSVPGFVHLGIGQEAIMAGTCFNLQDGDTIGASHREHGVLLCRGIGGDRLMAELYGRKTGICKGKGGSMHAGDLAKGTLGCNGILGAAQTIINGFAFAHKFRNDGKIAVTMFGDGAANRGEFHEGLNFAAIWNLPTVYMINNNGYAISVPKSKQNKMDDLSARGAAYGVPGVQIDGNDIFAVLEATSEAFKRAREGGGPTLIESKTYRWRGHFEGDPDTYRSEEEKEFWKEKCPIKRFEKYLLEHEVMNQAEIDDVWKMIKDRVDGHQKFAEESPWPTEEDLLSDVYYNDEGSVLA